jgi:hypothetical protein
MISPIFIPAGSSGLFVTVNELLTKLFYISISDDFMGDGCDVQDIHRSHVACG